MLTTNMLNDIIMRQVARATLYAEVSELADEQD